jgi:peroxiredoxin
MANEVTEQEPERLTRVGSIGKRAVSLITLAIVVAAVIWWVAARRAPAILSDSEFTLATAQTSKTAALVGAPAPDIAMIDNQGRVTHLSDLRGKPVYINFWATWCIPCREEMPEIVHAYAQHNNENLVILGVNVEEGPQEVRDFANTFKMNFPITLDSKGQVIAAYGVVAMPTSVFVDAQGIIRARWQGSLSAEQIEEHLRTILQ